MPIVQDIRDHKVFGPAYRLGLREGAESMLRLLIRKRFGDIPPWAEERLASWSQEQLEQFAYRLLESPSLKDLMMSII